MTPALLMTYALRDVPSSNRSPYAHKTQGRRSSGRRRKRRSPLAIAFPSRPRVSLFGRRAAVSN